MVTAELAVAIPALLVVLGLCLGALRLGTDTLRCHDAAAVTARLLARGEDPEVAVSTGLRAAPSGSRVEWQRQEGIVLVSVRAGGLTGLGLASGRAVAHDEAVGAQP